MSESQSSRIVRWIWSDFATVSMIARRAGRNVEILETVVNIEGWKDLLEGLRVGLPDSFEDREADLAGVCDGFEDRGVDLVGLCDSVEDREVGRVKKLRSLETVVKIEGWKDM